MSYGQTQKSLIGFQNIPWGSSIAVVRGKFPNVREFDYCKLLATTNKPYRQLKEEFSNKSLSCISLQVEHYPIEGNDFNLTFEFDELNRLKGVNLSAYFDSENNPKYLADCGDSFQNTENLLTTRYGEKSTVSNAEKIDDAFQDVHANVWLPLPTEVYIAKLWNSKVRKTLGKTDFCKVSVHYGKRVPNAASKL